MELAVLEALQFCAKNIFSVHLGRKDLGDSAVNMDFFAVFTETRLNEQLILVTVIIAVSRKNYFLCAPLTQDFERPWARETYRFSHPSIGHTLLGNSSCSGFGPTFFLYLFSQVYRGFNERYQQHAVRLFNRNWNNVRPRPPRCYINICVKSSVAG